MTKVCFNCEHWGDDKGLTQRRILAHGADSVLAWKDGYPGDATCTEAYLWAYIGVTGDARVVLTVPGNFGCVLWHGK